MTTFLLIAEDKAVNVNNISIITKNNCFYNSYDDAPLYGIQISVNGADMPYNIYSSGCEKVRDAVFDRLLHDLSLSTMTDCRIIKFSDVVKGVVCGK